MRHSGSGSGSSLFRPPLNENRADRRGVSNRLVADPRGPWLPLTVEQPSSGILYACQTNRLQFRPTTMSLSWLLQAELTNRSRHSGTADLVP